MTSHSTRLMLAPATTAAAGSHMPMQPLELVAAMPPSAQAAARPPGRVLTWNQKLSREPQKLW
jgi:hypothetical protein